MVISTDITITIKAAMELTGLTQPRLERLLAQGRVIGAYKDDKGKWLIPQPTTILSSRRPMQAREGVRYIAAPRMPQMPPLPDGTFRCHVIDPPWPMEKIQRRVRPNQKDMDYSVMTLEEIARLPVAAKTDTSGAHLYLWTTLRYIPDALQIMGGWGFTYQCPLIWVKNGGITPYSWQYNAEIALFGKRGGLALNQLGIKLAFHADRREHSRKPEAFYDMVMRATPGPRMEWFARQPREGFVVWGDQSDHFGDEDE